MLPLLENVRCHVEECVESEQLDEEDDEGRAQELDEGNRALMVQLKDVHVVHLIVFPYPEANSGAKQVGSPSEEHLEHLVELEKLTPVEKAVLNRMAQMLDQNQQNNGHRAAKEEAGLGKRARINT